LINEWCNALSLITPTNEGFFTVSAKHPHKRMRMTSAVMTTGGRITIPAPVRVALGLAAGNRVEFILEANGQYFVVAARPGIQTLKGILKKPPSPCTIEQMQQAIRIAVRRLP
jgi:antitoxin PrlF